MIRLSAILLLCSMLICADELPIEDRLDSHDRSVAMAALHELARRGPPGSKREIEAVRTRLSETEPGMRLAAAGAAARLSDDGSIPQLIIALREANGEDTSGFRGALASIAGSDIGGDDPDAWQGWHDNITESTANACAKVRESVEAGDMVGARSALHPLLMQRAGRDTIVDLLGELAAGTDERLATMAREGLAAMNTPEARMVLAGAGDPEAIAADGDGSAAMAGGAGGAAGGTGGRSAKVVPERSSGGVGWGILVLVIAVIAAVVYPIVRDWPRTKRRLLEVTGSFTRRFGGSKAKR